ncbi:MAG: hypothetical protein WA737_15405 [Candidatus Acidiferrales bacterium]
MIDWNAKGLRLYLIVATLLIAPSLQSQQFPAAAGSAKAIVIMAEKTKTGVSYKVDSRPVTDLLLSLSRLEVTRGSSCPVIALIDPRLPIEEIWTIDGTAGKAQFTNVRFFIFFRETGKMAEVHTLPAVSFSTNL